MNIELVKQQLFYLQKKKLDEGVVFFPETPDTLLNQLERVVKGEKAIMLFHMLDSVSRELYRHIENNSLCTAYDHRCGVIVTRDGSLIEKALVALNRDELGLILGYGVPNVPSAIENTFAVCLYNKDGVQKEGISCTFEEVPKVINAILDNFYQVGDNFKIIEREEFRKNRLDKYNSFWKVEEGEKLFNLDEDKAFDWLKAVLKELKENE